MPIPSQTDSAWSAPPDCWTFRHSGLILSVLLTLGGTARLEADDQDTLWPRLATKRSALIDGQGYRDAIESIARAAEVNIWLDRRVDPTLPVPAGPVGPTTFAALRQLAALSDCAVMPIANVVLIGRTEWVDQTAAAVAALDLDTNRSAAIADLSWTEVTTPAEALRIAVGTDVEVEPPLPHDLWPAVNWRQVDRRVAVTLILAQFDRRPESTSALARLRTVPATPQGEFTRRYELPTEAGVFRTAFTAADGRSKIGPADRALIATGPIAAHRLAIHAWFDATATAPLDPDRARFTIQQLQSTAATAFQQLAALAGRQCQIEPEAVAACRRQISLQGNDLTLRELTEQVARAVGVVVRWQPQTIVVSAPPTAER